MAEVVPAQAARAAAALPDLLATARTARTEMIAQVREVQVAAVQTAVLPGQCLFRVPAAAAETIIKVREAAVRVLQERAAEAAVVVRDLQEMEVMAAAVWLFGRKPEILQQLDSAVEAAAAVRVFPDGSDVAASAEAAVTEANMAAVEEAPEMLRHSLALAVKVLLSSRMLPIRVKKRRRRAYSV